MIVSTDAARDATRNEVVNQRVAYPYAITLNTNGLRSSIIARNTLSAFIGCMNRPQVPTAAATVIATSARASKRNRSMVIVQFTANGVDVAFSPAPFP